MMRVAGATLLAVVLTGCATPYEPASLTGVYNAVDRSGYTSHDTARQLALLQAADRTLQAGFTRFVWGPGTQSSIAGSTPLVADQVRSTVVMSGGDVTSAPTGDAVIRMVRVGDPDFAGAFDAKLVYQQLKAKFSSYRAHRLRAGRPSIR